MKQLDANRMATTVCPICRATMSFQPPVKVIPDPWLFGEFSAWLFAVLFIGAFVALGFSKIWVAAGLGAIAGVFLFLKFAKDTKDDPAEGLYLCSPCKRYFKASSIAVMAGDEVAK